MKKRVAVLLDGEFVLIKLRKLVNANPVTAKYVYEFANVCLNDDEELFRIYYYDCPSFGKTRKTPLDERINFSNTNSYKHKTALLREIAVMDGVAFRSGKISFDGWQLKEGAIKEIIESSRSIRTNDIRPCFRQKQVDMKIGLDVAWLSSKRIVDRIILATGDSDFVPAMKFARREGVQVVLAPMGHKLIKRSLREHADEVREVNYPPSD